MKRKLLFAAIHLWLAYHLVAIVISPASVPPTSDAVRNLWSGFRHYLQATYLNHGYHYFAPDPGNSTIVRFVAELPNGRSQIGQVPDRNELWPRLFYHRHLLLTEYLGSLPPGSHQLRDAVLESYALVIAEKNNAAQVQISQVTHRAIEPERIMVGGAINDPETYDLEATLTIERVIQ